VPRNSSREYGRGRRDQDRKESKEKTASRARGGGAKGRETIKQQGLEGWVERAHPEEISEGVRAGEGKKAGAEGEIMIGGGRGKEALTAVESMMTKASNGGIRAVLEQVMAIFEDGADRTESDGWDWKTDEVIRGMDEADTTNVVFVSDRTNEGSPIGGGEVANGFGREGEVQGGPGGSGVTRKAVHVAGGTVLLVGVKMVSVDEGELEDETARGSAPVPWEEHLQKVEQVSDGDREDVGAVPVGEKAMARQRVRGVVVG
jgi:hypothetical protein